jgi:hypothetical protein
MTTIFLKYLRQIAAGQRPRLRVFNSLQKELIDVTAPLGEPSFTTAANIPEGGTYYVELLDNNGAQIDNLYALDIAFDISDNCEYNNNFTKACDYTIGQSYEGKICGFDGNSSAFSSIDADFFVFNAISTGLHNFKLNNFPAGSRLRMRVFNDVQQEVADATSGLSVSLFTLQYTIPRGGRYFVVIQDNNGVQRCDGSYKFQIDLATPTSDVTDNINMSISPNPVIDKLSINCSETSIKSIQITNITGQVLLQKALNDKQTDIDVSSLSKGLYLLSIETTDGRRGVQKFVKN